MEFGRLQICWHPVLQTLVAQSRAPDRPRVAPWTPSCQPRRILDLPLPLPLIGSLCCCLLFPRSLSPKTEHTSPKKRGVGTLCPITELQQCGTDSKFLTHAKVIATPQSISHDNPASRGFTKQSRGPIRKAGGLPIVPHPKQLWIPAPENHRQSEIRGPEELVLDSLLRRLRVSLLKPHQMHL